MNTTQKIETENKFDFKNILNEKLKSNQISNFKIILRENRKYNIYVEKNYKIESILNSKREEKEVIIYKEYDDNLMGTSSFNIDDNVSEDDFLNQLNDALFICSQSKNKKYSLAKKEDIFVDDSNINYDDFYSKKFEDYFNSKSLSLFYQEKLDLFKKIIKEKSNEYPNLNVKLNTIEFLNNLNSTKLEISTGIKKQKKSNSSYMEFVITVEDKKEKENKSEYIVYEKINDIFKFNFENFFTDSINSAIISTKKSTIDNFKGEVILIDNACSDFFIPDLTQNPLVGHSSARLKDLNISQFEPEKSVINSKKDKITIYSNPLLKSNSASTPFDLDGICAKRIPLIENSIFKNYFASKKYADYLKLNPTGPLGVIEVKTGEKSINELQESQNKIIEIKSFSSFVPDMISGDFSAEIRLGIIIKNGKKTPFKGGLFTGNIFKLLEETHLSKEVQEKVGYLGPKAIKFYNADIVGNN